MREGKLSQMQALLRIGRAGGQGLMRRNGCGDDEQRIERKQSDQLLRGQRVALMGRVEAAAVYAEPAHRSPSSLLRRRSMA